MFAPGIVANTPQPEKKRTQEKKNVEGRGVVAKARPGAKNKHHILKM